MFWQQMVNAVSLGALYALLAIGYTMVYGIIKLINFAHGEFYMVSAYAGFLIYSLLPAGGAGGLVRVLVYAAIVVVGSGVVGAAVAVLTERIAYRPIRRSGRLAALLTAIGVSLFLQGVFTFVNNAKPLQYDTAAGTLGAWCQKSIVVGDAGIRGIRFVFIPVTIGLTALLWFIVMRTRFGKAMRAVSQDHDAAALMGIDANRVIRRTFMLGGFLAGVAGSLVAFQSTITPTMGFQPGLKAFIAAVVGGIGSIPGAVLGGYLLGIAEHLMVWAGVPTGFKDIAAFLLLIVCLMVRPQGILGKREREKV